MQKRNVSIFYSAQKRFYYLNEVLVNNLAKEKKSIYLYLYTITGSLNEYPHTTLPLSNDDRYLAYYFGQTRRRVVFSSEKLKINVKCLEKQQLGGEEKSFNVFLGEGS